MVTRIIQHGDISVIESVQFYFDFGSPTSYLASRALPAIAREAGVSVDWQPVLLGGIFQAIGNASPMDLPQKSAWMRADMQRWAKKWGVDYQYNPFFPINSLILQRGAVAYQHGPLFERYVQTIFSAMWEHPQNLGDPAILTQVLTHAGFDGSEFLALVGSAEVKARLRANTDEAVSKGVFGCPTFFVGEEMFFGQDRLEFVRDALNANRVVR
jgi:2-hydroxychromene-2-carboxylate isomerase